MNISISRKMKEEADKLAKRDLYKKISNENNKRQRRDIVFEKAWKAAQQSIIKEDKNQNPKNDIWVKIIRLLRGCVDQLPRLSEKEEEQLLQELEDLTDQKEDKQLTYFVKQC